MDSLVIVNTGSGGLASRAGRRALLDAMQAAGMEAPIVTVRTGLEIAAAVRSHRGRGCRVVIAAGGDGTVSGVATALLGTQASLGIVPGGTLNHFARDLNIPHDLGGALDVLKTGVTRRVDVATVNGYLFLNNSSLGIYPDIVLEREEMRRRGIRKTIALLLASIRTMVRFPRLRVRVGVNGRIIERSTPFLFVGNNPYEFEGAHLGSRPRIDTGELSICVARESGRVVALKAMLQIFLPRVGSVRGLDVFRAQDAWIRTRAPVAQVSLDGAVIRIATPLRYEIHPQALSVIVPSGVE